MLDLRTIQQLSFVGLGLISTLSCLLAFQLEAYYLLAVPGLFAIGLLSIINFKSIYYLLLIVMPVSIEIYFSSSLGTDLPSEPLTIGLMAITLLYVAMNLSKLSLKFMTHPLFVLLGIHCFWIFVTAINAEVPLVSLKYFLAKSWYVIVFTLLSLFIIKREENFRPVFWCIFLPLTALAIQALIRHSMISFSFDEVNTPVMPFFRNHVNYAAMLTLMLPFIFLARNWYDQGTFKRRLLSWSIPLYFFAIYFSYTRACMLALVVMVAVYVVIRWNLLRPLLPLALLVVLLFSGYMVNQNKYLDFSPTYEKTVHHDRFDDHISATIALEDASSMERFYRWIAAGFMVAEKPWLGYGPGNFFPYYKQHTVTSFETYLSENEERSTVHNYFLLVLVEQGIIGLIIFLALTFYLFSYGEKLYRTICNKSDRPYVMAILLCLVAIYVNLLFSDLIEANKIGPMFFMSIALLINVSQDQKESPSDSLSSGQ